MKKGLKVTLLLLAGIVFVALLFFILDYTRVQKQQKPLFCIPVETYRDGGTKVYYGLGYKVIAFHKIVSFDEDNNQMKYYEKINIGTWFMDYHDFEEEIKVWEKQESEKVGQDTAKATMKAVVVKVEEKHLMVMGLEYETGGLITIGAEETSKFKKGQEISIHFDGTVMTTYPAQLSHVEKIEILKERSDIEIPEPILRYCYSSQDNVDITIVELTNTKIAFTITDTNELPYLYAHSYQINQKVKNEAYTGVGYKIGEDTKNTTSGYTRDGLRIYLEGS